MDDDDIDAGQWGEEQDLSSAAYNLLPSELSRIGLLGGKPTRNTTEIPQSEYDVANQDPNYASSLIASQ